ncbi:MAG: phosphoribosyltransferase family protein [Campylobacterota bacterium]|nr:phosphoribosyltransferase family protein [Campylobacterota bacterium]
MDKLYYGYKDCIKDCKLLLPQIKLYNPDALVSIARGGLTFGHLLAEGLDTRKIYTINSIHYENEKKLDSFDIFNIPDISDYKKVILVDDIVDSGETMVEILKILTQKYPKCEFKIVTIFYKKTALIQPDFSVREAKNWIEFFWEVDLK